MLEVQMTPAKLLCSILIFVNSAHAFTDEIKIRAREHFESHEYSVDRVNEVFEFKGLTIHRFNLVKKYNFG